MPVVFKSLTTLNISTVNDLIKLNNLTFWGETLSKFPEIPSAIPTLLYQFGFINIQTVDDFKKLLNVSFWAETFTKMNVTYVKDIFAALNTLNITVFPDDLIKLNNMTFWSGVATTL